MAKYSEEFKHSIMLRMMPPQNQSVSAIARETGLSEATLHLWRKQARAKGMAVPGGEQEVERWSTQDKFLIVMETALLSEVEMAEYCRCKGLYGEQVQAWRDACMQLMVELHKKRHVFRKICVRKNERLRNWSKSFVVRNQLLQRLLRYSF